MLLKLSLMGFFISRSECQKVLSASLVIITLNPLAFNPSLYCTVNYFVGLKMSWIFLLMENLNLGVTKLHANLD